MRYRRFGNTELTVSELGFGCARIGGVFRGGSRLDQLSLVRAAFEAGITFFDTADMYAQGESERLIGDAFRKDRHRVVVASKVGYEFRPPGRVVSRLKPLARSLLSRARINRERIPRSVLTTVSAQNFSVTYVERMLEASLRRLHSDYLDLYQLHSPPAEVLERGEFVALFQRLQQQGKIRCWGIACEQPADVLTVLRCVPQASAIQISLSLLHPESADEAIPSAAETGAGVIARQVFASGLLTRAASLDIEDPRHAQILEFRREAGQDGLSLPALALRYVLRQPGVSVALVGMHRREHLAANLSYLDELTG